ncbi:DUF4352 domain-containing protein [Streptomyces aidingensis]|uniref:DUF4352 domain-containing protein n=1 Tax=Streptomyces aidingensis TaxID=910347 RepID=A0A1I1GSI5_9ACTN|nr:DUF4352 domain-containing protein [Streptomyces aidingensis]SFC14614.1 protein of unknown function [Streptomyces aidingensis]
MRVQRATGRGRRTTAVAGAVAAAVLALGGLTACEEPLPPDAGEGSSQQPDADGGDDGAADGGDGGDGAGDGGGDGGGDEAGDGGGEDAPAEADEGFLAAGETHRYPNGLEVTLSAAEPYTPADYVEYTGTPCKTTVTVTNNGAEETEIIFLFSARAGDAGVEAPEIFDGELAAEPQGTLKPGRTFTGEVAFDVPEGADFIDVTVDPLDIDLDPAYWNLRL